MSSSSSVLTATGVGGATKMSGNSSKRGCNNGCWNAGQKLLLLLFVSLAAQSQGGSISKGESVTTTMVRMFHKPKELVFADEFFSLDPNTWSHEVKPPGDKNGEFQSYTASSENSYVRDGILYIKPTYNNFPHSPSSRRNRSIAFDASSANELYGSQQTLNPIQSARLNCREAFAFQYGQLEVRAKLPQGDWIWPAIWLLPQSYYYGEWPMSGEIDVVESRGNLQLVTSAGQQIGSSEYGSTLHFGLDRQSDMWRLAHFAQQDSRGFHSRFHDYGMIWTPDEIAFTLDSVITGVVRPPKGGFWEMGNFTGPSIWSPAKISPFDQPFNLVLNVAVGGTFGFFPDNTGPQEKPWNNSSPTALEDFWRARDQWQPSWKGEESALQVDHVRIWAL